uniref:XPG N-terminal domain-containing protein n=1 Tax=viral metagenome TaxID=1070528 RepID=A0A6C0C3C8_9ZZZZ
MGIKLLNSFLKNYCTNGITEKHLSNFYGKKIAIDISIYMYKYKSEEQLIEKIYLMCCIFDYYNIIPIFVFDGKPPEEKKHTLITRREERNYAKDELNKIMDDLRKNNVDADTYVLNYKNKIRALKKQSVKITNDEFDKIKRLIDGFGMTYVVADSEAETLCAKLLYKKQVHYCLSEDTDMFVYLSPYTLRYISLSNHKVLLYDLKKILINLNLTRSEFVSICVLSGNDYYNGNKNIYYYYKMIMKYKKICNNVNDDDNDTFIEFLKKKRIINDALIEDFNKNKKMYHLQNDKGRIKFNTHRKNKHIINSILTEADFIFE